MTSSLKVAWYWGLSLVRVQGWTAIKGKHIAGTHIVSLAEGLSEDEVACVLAHEISHAVQHPPGTPIEMPTSEERSRAERVAHGAAALILRDLNGPDYEAIALRVGYAEFVALGSLQKPYITEARQIAEIVVRAATWYRAG
jgi:hypothetical protein